MTRMLDWEVNADFPNPEEHIRNIPLIFDAESSLTLHEQLTFVFPGIQPAPPDFGFEFSADNCLVYPGLPPLPPVARAVHLGEQVFIYPAGFFVALQLAGNFSVYKLEH